MKLLLLWLVTNSMAGPADMDRICRDAQKAVQDLAVRGVHATEFDDILARCDARTPALFRRSALPTRVSTSTATSFTTPVPGRLTSRFGWRDYPLDRSRRQFHKGVDIGAPRGTPVRVAAAGEVKRAGVRGGYGKSVQVDHGDGTVTMYNHLSAIHVREGQQLASGQQLGAVGSTGKSTGPHLHYSVVVNGVDVDPLTHPTLAPELEIP